MGGGRISVVGGNQLQAIKRQQQANAGWGPAICSGGGVEFCGWGYRVIKVGKIRKVPGFEGISEGERIGGGRQKLINEVKGRETPKIDPKIAWGGGGHFLPVVCRGKGRPKRNPITVALRGLRLRKRKSM